MAIDILFDLVERGYYNLMWSFILDYDNSLNPFLNRKHHIQSISSLCTRVIKPNNEIKKLAFKIVDDSSASEKDALHLASAIYGNCDYFISCDDRFVKTINVNRNRLKESIGNIDLYNPIDFLRKEMSINVIE